MRASLVLGVVAATALVGAAVAVLGGRHEPGVAADRPAASPLAARLGAVPAPAAPGGTAPAPVAPAAPREQVPAPEACAAAAADFLRAAVLDRNLAVVTAEVIAVGAIQRGVVGEGSLEHQDVRLRLLTVPRDGALRRYAVLEAPLVPAVSQQLHGCSTPFGALAAGQVRTVVLGRGRPDLGTLAKLLSHRARWLVLAGPEVERPADPVLAAVPAELQGWLGRPAPSVFRARVAVVAAAAAPPADGRRDLAREFGRLEVDVTHVAQQGSGRSLRGRVRLAPEPFVGRLDTASLVVGSEWWFVSEDLGLIHVLRAFAPLR